MPQELIIHNWCDMCFRAGHQTEGHPTESIALGRGAPKTLLLCEEHRTQLLGELHDLLGKFGQAVEKPTSAPKPAKPAKKAPALSTAPGPTGELSCPVEDCEFSGTKNSIKHHIGSHGLTLPQAAYKADQTLEGKPIKFVCKEGPCKKVPSGFAVKTALVQHLTRIHDHAPGMDVAPYAA